MLPFGHISASYLISHIPYEPQIKLRKIDTYFILFCGIIFDFDFFVPNIFGYPSGTHHLFPTHTPLAGIIYGFLLYFIFKKYLLKKTFVLAYLAMLSHLVLDDLSYWLYLIGLEKALSPQIFWAYPFDSRLNIEINRFLTNFKLHPYTNLDVLNLYLFRLPRLFYLEIVLTISAFIVWCRKKVKNQL